MYDHYMNIEHKAARLAAEVAKMAAERRVGIPDLIEHLAIEYGRNEALIAERETAAYMDTTERGYW